MLDGPWRAPHDLVWTRYPDSEDWAVFNPQSGDVHLVTASAYFLWQTIATSNEITTGKLLAALADHVQMPLEADLITAADQTLQFMDRAGLITPNI
jgi:PqqD family protein of HPr-rel-A system